MNETSSPQNYCSQVAQVVQKTDRPEDMIDAAMRPIGDNPDTKRVKIILESESGQVAHYVWPKPNPAKA